MNVNEELKVFLQKLDKTEIVTSETNIHDKIRQFRNNLEKKGIKEPIELKAESLAFAFVENYQEQSIGWGTYYGPMMVGKNENGQWIESPSIQLVTTKIIEYWSTRAKEAENSILKARYSDLVWDFSQKVLNKAAGVKYAHITIDQNIEIAKKSYHKYETSIIVKLERALNLSISINDKGRIEKVISSIIEYEDKISVDTKPGLWGFSFDFLIGNKKISLSEKIINKIINDLEQRLERITSNVEASLLDPFAAESVAMRLISYYRKQSKTNEVKRVLKKYAEAFIKASEHTSPLVAVSWLNKVYNVLFSNGMKNDADNISKLIKEAGEKSREEMHTFSHAVEISKEEIDKYLEEISEGTASEALNRIALHFIPKRDELEKQVKDIASKAPLQGLLSISLHDEEGRTVASIGSVEDDLEGRIIYQLSENLKFENQFLYWALDRVISKHGLNYDNFLKHFYQSPLYAPDRKEVIGHGLKAHIRGEYITSCYILVIEIEAALRRLLHLSGGSIYRPHRLGGIRERTLEEILRDPIVTKVLGTDLIIYFRAFLTDQRGWNVRNNICHGLMNFNTFGIGISNRLVHCLLILSFVRAKSTNNNL